MHSYYALAHMCGMCWCKPRPCPRYSRRRDHINLGLLCSYYNFFGGGVHRWWREHPPNLKTKTAGAGSGVDATEAEAALVSRGTAFRLPPTKLRHNAFTSTPQNDCTHVRKYHRHAHSALMAILPLPRPPGTYRIRSDQKYQYLGLGPRSLCAQNGHTRPHCWLGLGVRLSLGGMPCCRLPPVVVVL